MAGYKKIRDLGAFNTITKDHIVPVATPVGSSSESTGHTTASNFFGAFLGGSSSMELDANGKLKIKTGAVSAEQFEPGALESSDASVQNATSATEMADLTGQVLTIDTGNFGSIVAMVITDHPAANDIGPSPRQVTVVASGNSSLSCNRHGFGHPTSTTRHEVTIYSKDGEIPEPLDPSSTYFAQEVDRDSFQLFPTASGGSAVVFSNTGSGTIMVRRRNVFALRANGGGTSPNAYDAYWGDSVSVALNNVFSTVEGAYNWILRNNAGDNVVVFVGSSTYRNNHWNPPGSSSGRFEADPEFTLLNKIRITGNQWDGTTTRMGFGGTKKHWAQDLASLRIHVKAGGLQLWFREAIHRLQFLGFVYDAQNNATNAPSELYRSSSLGQILHSSFRMENYSSGTYSGTCAMAVGEGENTFMSGTMMMDFYGDGSNNFTDNPGEANISVIATLQGGRGFFMPNGTGYFKIITKSNTEMGKMKGEWVYINAAANCTLAANRNTSYSAATALINAGSTALQAWT